MKNVQDVHNFEADTKVGHLENMQQLPKGSDIITQDRRQICCLLQ